MTTLVIQSAPPGLPAWQERCLASVAAWAAHHGFAYRLCGDELFALLPAWARRKTAGRPQVAADIARLLWARAVLAAGWRRVAWVDADVLVFDPARLALPETSAAFGREIWVQYDRRGRLRAYRNVHNAICAFHQDDTTLPFYADKACDVLARLTTIPANQILGPKLLTALHGIVGLDLIPEAGMLSPPVMADLLAGGGPALAKQRAHQPATPAAVNLAASLTGDPAAGRAAHDAGRERVCRLLLTGGAAWLARTEAGQSAASAHATG